jgi:hypothetical protein
VKIPDSNALLAHLLPGNRLVGFVQSNKNSTQKRTHTMARNNITGRSAFLALLKDEGVTHLFGNPGTTELPVMHALKDIRTSPT